MHNHITTGSDGFTSRSSHVAGPVAVQACRATTAACNTPHVQATITVLPSGHGANRACRLHTSVCLSPASSLFTFARWNLSQCGSQSLTRPSPTFSHLAPLSRPCTSCRVYQAVLGVGNASAPAPIAFTLFPSLPVFPVGLSVCLISPRWGVPCHPWDVPGV